MKAGDRIVFVAERGAEPQHGVVVSRYGTWVDVVLDDGSRVEQALAAQNHFQSPKGHYCVISEQLPAL